MVTRRIRIVHDDNADSPREADNLGTMCCWHRRYNLGDSDYKCMHPMDQLYDMAKDAGEEVDEQLSSASMWEAVKRHYVILPLFLYDHGGLTMSTTTFSDPWDSGQVGFIYVSMESLRKENPGKTDDELRTYAERILTSEVDVYDDYLGGETYGFEVEELTEDGSWTYVNSCYGFLGSDPTTNGISDYVDDSDAPLKEAMSQFGKWVEYTVAKQEAHV